MSVIDVTPEIDSDIQLPVSSLSVSSLNLYSRCPLSWKRRYIDHEPERVNGKMVIGSAAGAALAQHYGARIAGEQLAAEDVLDEYASEFDTRAQEEEPDWQDDTPGSLKDSGAAALDMYLRLVAPNIIPAAVEREVTLEWPGVSWRVTGYIDLETVDGVVVDYKLSGKKMTDAAAAAEIQPTMYLAARRAEGNPADRFDYHCLIRTKTPQAYALEAPRTERQLDALTRRIFTVARSIEWRWLNDCWEGTPPDLAWLCKGCTAVDCDWRRA